MNDSARSHYESFENLVKLLMSLLQFEVIEDKSKQNSDGYEIDFLIVRDSIKAICEVKFYRSRVVSTSSIFASSRWLGEVCKRLELPGILIVSCLVARSTKEQLKDRGIIVWDRSNIANFLLEVNREDLLEVLGRLIADSQQGTDISYPYEEIDEDTERDPLKYFFNEVPDTLPPLNRGEQLIGELQAIPLGKKAWVTFENKCVEILKYMFEPDLSVWDTQVRTDDNLSRYDLISRIISTDDFWRTLIHSFNSRYVLFEFKNYAEQIPAGQIYTTERYLFPKALRAVAIILTRKGASPNAISAAKGALRESGKLILIFSQEEIEEMLRRKDRGDSPNDYLSDKLDELLIALSR